MTFLLRSAALTLALALTSVAAHAAFPPLALKAINTGQIYSPTTITHAGDGSGRLFVCDQPGLIYIIENGSIQPTPFLDLSATAANPADRKVYPPNNLYSERGLLGLTFHPGYANPSSPGYRKFYVNYIKPYVAGVDPGPLQVGDPVDAVSVIAEFQVSENDPNLADPASERRLLVFTQPQSNHNGGMVEFGPEVGANGERYLYIGQGDGGSQMDNNAGHTGGSGSRPTDNLGNAQDKTRLLGKILRIDPLGTNGPGGQYGIPVDNPFVGAGGGVREEIYSYGMRNPWRFSFDKRPGGTNRLFCADVGGDRVEEVDIIVKGGNYGWRYLEGTEMPVFSSGAPSNPMADPGGTMIPPIAQYAHPGQIVGNPPLPQLGRSITGGFVYRGARIPALRGKYVFGDYGSTNGASDGRMMGLEETAPGSGVFTLTQALPIFGGNPIIGQRILTMGEDESGEIYVGLKTTPGVLQLDANNLPAGGIYQIVAQQRVVTTLTPSQDNTIFSEDPTLGQNFSDGQGYLHVGRTGPNFGPYNRRGLVAFDVSGRLPSDALVHSASFQMNLNKQGGGAAGSTMTLHRLTETWGEGASANPNGGFGAQAATSDATWAYRFFSSSMWTAPGGSFDPTPSASRVIDNVGLQTWNSTAAMVSDVQGWLANPASNAGWLLKGDETHLVTACQFDSGELGSSPPKLIVDYDTAYSSASIASPDDIVVEATGGSGAVVTYSAAAFDYFGGPLSFTSDRASGSTFPVGTTTVTLSCNDGLGNVAMSSFTVTVQDTTKPTIAVPGPITQEATGPNGAIVTFNVTTSDAVTSAPNLEVSPASGSLFPVGQTTVNVTSTDAASNVATSSFTVTVQDTTNPTIGGNFPSRTTSVTTVPDYTSLPTTSDLVGPVNVTQSPAPGSALALGPTVITLTAHDGADNQASLHFTLTRYPADPDHQAKFSTGGEVPGAGSLGGAPANATFRSFGVPAINEAGQLAFFARWVSPEGSGSGIFAGNPAVLVAKAGDLAPGAEPAKFATFTDPVLDAEGHVAFLATLSGASRTTNSVVATNAFNNTLAVVARTGSPVSTGGAKFKAFREVSLVEGELLLTATLAGGTPAARKTTDEAGFRISNPANPPELVVREGDPFGGAKVKAFKLLSVVAGSPGQNRGHNLGTASFLVLLNDRTQALVDSTGGVLTDFAATGDTTGGTLLPDATFKAFGPVSTDLNQTGFAATLSVGVGGVTADKASAVFLGTGSAFEPVAQQGLPAADLNTLTFKSFLDPVLAPGKPAFAFPARLKGAGVRATNDMAIFYRPDGGNLRSVAREGDHPPGTPTGVKWKSFVSLALPAGDTGPIFHALLSGAGVRTTNNAGVWAVNTNDQVVLLFRKGDPVGGRPLRNFTVLNAARGSTGTTRSFNQAALVAWRADFAGGQSSIVVTSVP